MPKTDETTELAAKIRAVKEKHVDKTEVPPPGASRYSIELVSGTVVGGLIGWGLDHLIGTKPWFFIVCLILGIVGGFFNIVRLAKRQNLGHTGRDSK